MSPTNLVHATNVEPSWKRAAVRLLRAASPLVADVVLRAQDEGFVALVRLDPLLVRSRAIQQGLEDTSIGSAAADPRVRGMLDAALARAHDACPDGERIVRYEVVVDPPIV
ncbi:MAG: hypothetical protein JSS99_00380 [Actinobacteria bacterium]|nr:hypothetical protein [Actinomycetota bacterium]